MRSVTNRAAIVRRLALILMVLALALVAASCGGGKDDLASLSTVTTGQEPVTTAAASTDTSAAATTESTAAPVTTLAASTTTMAGATTTTAKATTTTAKATTTTAKATTTTAASGPVVLKLSGPSGSKTFTMAELQALPSISGYGGWKNQSGAITQPASWKGVSLSSLMKLVGGGSYCNVVASDGYTSSVTPGAAMGTYDPATGESLEGVKVTAILAYAKNGGPLGGEEGPLRIAFITPESNQVTDGSEWARMVVEIKVK
jgi:hypothetical protein